MPALQVHTKLESSRLQFRQNRESQDASVGAGCVRNVDALVVVAAGERIDKGPTTCRRSVSSRRPPPDPPILGVVSPPTAGRPDSRPEVRLLAWTTAARLEDGGRRPRRSSRRRPRRRPRRGPQRRRLRYPHRSPGCSAHRCCVTRRCVGHAHGGWESVRSVTVAVSVASDSADGLEGLQSPSIQDILVALPADFDLQPASDGSALGSLPARGQMGEAWRRAQPYHLPEHRPRSVGANFQPSFSQMPSTADQALHRRQQPTAAAEELRERQLSQPSGFEPDQWSRSGRAAQAADAAYFSERPAQYLDAPQWHHHQKRRRVSEAAHATASDRQRGQMRPVDGAMHHQPGGPPLSASPSLSSAASDDDDDGFSLARAISATRSQIDAMGMTPSSSVLSELEGHAKRKRPGKHVHTKRTVASETPTREPTRPPLHTGSNNGSPASRSAQVALESKPAAAIPPRSPSSTVGRAAKSVPMLNPNCRLTWFLPRDSLQEAQRAATVTVSTSSPHERQATCRVSWCSQPGKRFGLCWTHGGGSYGLLDRPSRVGIQVELTGPVFVSVKRCCESNCVRVALETSEFCSFHQPKHRLAGRTASI